MTTARASCRPPRNDARARTGRSSRHRRVGARDKCGWAEIFPIVDRRVASDVCPLFFQLGTGDMLRHTMERAGFTAIVVNRLSTTLQYMSDEEACGGAFAGGPVALAYSRFDASTRDEAHA